MALYSYLEFKRWTESVNLLAADTVLGNVLRTAGLQAAHEDLHSDPAPGHLLVRHQAAVQPHQRALWVGTPLIYAPPPHNTGLTPLALKRTFWKCRCFCACRLRLFMDWINNLSTFTATNFLKFWNKFQKTANKSVLKNLFISHKTITDNNNKIL